jgi:hypothetical protein
VALRRVVVYYVVYYARTKLIPALNLKTHAFFCMVMLIIALMPDAQPGGKAHAD